jgi:Fe-S-cluster containining protein
MSLTDSALLKGDTTCQSCGACCSYAPDWPRFTMEDDAALARIPVEFVDRSATGMLCDGDRCAALVGQVGASTSCAIYSDRPEVCRSCQIGDEACQMARRKHNLPVISN